MFVKNSFLFMSGYFFLLSFYAIKNHDLSIAIIFAWSGAVFCFLWLLHLLKVNFYRDYGKWLVRDSFLKCLLLGALLFPFLFIKYLALLIQSFGKEKPISQITDKIFIGQQLLWFHEKIFKEKNIAAVLDITVENREPYFIAWNKSVNYLRIPVLDKTSPSIKQLQQGVVWSLDQISQGRNLYVHCGAGHERSATFVCAMLLRLKLCKTLDQAIIQIQRSRPKARFVGNQQMILVKWFNESNTT